MERSITIVMYHYVRDLQRSRYPEIKGLTTNDFKEQIQYIKRHYNVISGQQLAAAVATNEELPPRAALLTFDDGYMDHYTAAFPVLDEAGLPACFFPPAKSTLEDHVLDVNKIHFVLASVPDKRRLVDFILRMLKEQAQFPGLLTAEAYWEKVGKPSRYDTAEVVFCKRMLQRELPAALRHSITDQLFREYVTKDEAAFARELYMNMDQVQVLLRHGMCIGSHGHEHNWLNTLSTQEQEAEIDKSLNFLAAVGVDLGQWIMCYPYGGYNESLLGVLRQRHCALGLTTKVGLATSRKSDRLEMPRLDTNDLPRQSAADLNAWTLQAMQ